MEEDQAPAAPNEPNARPPRNASNRKKRTATIPRGSPRQHEAESSRTDHSTTISTEFHATHHLGQSNGNVPGASFEPAGVFERAPTGDQVHTFPSPAPPDVQSKPRKQLKQARIVHSSPNRIRIALLSDQEQKTVTVDGGNTVSSQLSVLNSIEGLPPIGGANRIWIERPKIGRDKKPKTVYHCGQQGCIHHDSTAQKSRQHFVARHVEGAGWECPIDRCPHTRKHKRLDDLKNHHMVPEHDTKYYRGRESSEHPFNPLTTLGTSTLHPYASLISNPGAQDHQIGPDRANAGGVTRRARNAHRYAGPLNMNLRPRRNTTTSMAAAEHEEFQHHAPDLLHLSRIRSPMPEGLNYQTMVDANGFSPSMTPIEGISLSTPILAGDFLPPSNEPPSNFSPIPSHRSPINDPAIYQTSGLPQGRYSPSEQAFNWYNMEGASPATHASMSPHYPQPGTHVSSQSHAFSAQYPYDEEVARMHRRDGQPGHDPPVQDAPSDQAPSSSTFSPAPGSPYDHWRPQQQPLLYGGAPGTSSQPHLPPPHAETPRDYAPAGDALQRHPHFSNSWTSYPFDGTNVHGYGQASTSYASPRRLPNTSTSIRRNYGYPSDQVLSPSYGAFPFPAPQAAASSNRADEWSPYDDSSPNPDSHNFGDYEPRPEDHQPQI